MAKKIDDKHKALKEQADKLWERKYKLESQLHHVEDGLFAIRQKCDHPEYAGNPKRCVICRAFRVPWV